MDTGNISKSRIRRAATKRKQRGTGAENAIPFRDGALLACIYLAICALASVMLCYATHIFAIGDRNVSTWSQAFAAVLFSYICARVIMGYSEHASIRRNSHVLMMAILPVFSHAFITLFVFLIHKYCPSFITSENLFLLFPYLLVPVLATILLGTEVALIVGLCSALQFGAYVGLKAGMPVIFLAILMAAITPLAIKRVHRRHSLLKVLIRLSVLRIIATMGIIFPYLAAVENASNITAYREALILVGVCIAESVAVFALYPILEKLFGTCSNLRLYTFSDLSSPLLTRLAMEAPGTYHHSIVVASLASAAAENIGANALLARIGSYYHDIGKLNNPKFFTENIGAGEVNPHDALAPSMSALVLSAHVKDGIALAFDAGLPAPVRNIIAEHHGNSLMAYFLFKAKKAAEANGSNAESVDENLFRYPCPRPSSVEAALISLADSVEAASRSLQNPTPVAIEKLVSTIVNGKLSDGQLDSSNLTCMDINEVKRVFIASLITILHARIPYPSANGSKGKSNDKTIPTASNGSAETNKPSTALPH